MAKQQSFNKLVAAAAMAVLAAVVLLSTQVAASDPDPIQDFCVADLKSKLTINGYPCKPKSSVVSKDFFSSILAKPGVPDRMFGSVVTFGSVPNYPAINTLGLSMNRVDFALGGLNPPHTHPRATELILVVEGTLLIGIVTTDNVYYSMVLKPGMNAVIPRALLHFEANVGRTKAHFVTAFNAQDPGVLVASSALFGSSPTVPDFVLSKAYGGVNNTIIDLIKSRFASAGPKLIQAY